MKHSVLKNHKNLLLLFYIPLFIILLNCSSDKQVKAPVPEIPVVEVLQQDVPIFEEFVGQAYGLLDIPIRARVEGFLEGVHFDEGKPVQKGQLLYTIDSQPFLAEVAAKKSQVAEAETFLINAESEYVRYAALIEIDAVSKSDYDSRVARRDAAIASRDAAISNLELAKINLSYTRIMAPIKGVIGKTEARVGEFVGREPNPVILNTISRIDQMRIQFFVTETQYIALAREFKKGGTITPKKDRESILELILSDGSLYSEKGRVDFIDRNVDAMTGSMLVQGTFSNPNRVLRPGMFTKVKIRMEILENAILVPQRCVMDLQGQYSVYVIDNNNTVQARKIIVGKRIGDLWLINEGLKQGETIVIDALQKVGSGLVINPQLTEFKSQTN